MMMPSEYERSRLDEIEAALRASDPGLDRALRTFQPRRVWPVVCLIAGWLAVVGAGLINWWILVLVLLGPLLAFTCIALSRQQEESAPEPTGNWRYPPMWTRFWG